jgi:hypothetical protein
MNMPHINLTELKQLLPADDYELVAGIVNTRNGLLRASKPQLPKKVRVESDNEYGYTFAYANDVDARKGMTAYIWRMVAFNVSPHSQHHCMPCTADFDLPGHHNKERMTLAKRLDDIVDVVVKTVPVEQWYGVSRWSGLIGR